MGRRQPVEPVTVPNVERAIKAVLGEVLRLGALSHLLAGDETAARRWLDETFESVCERRAPTSFPTPVGEAACHRHDDRLADDATWTD